MLKGGLIKIAQRRLSQTEIWRCWGRTDVLRKREFGCQSIKPCSLIPRCQDYKPTAGVCCQDVVISDSTCEVCGVQNKLNPAKFSFCMKPLEGAGVANLQTLFAFPGGYSHFARCVGVHIANLCTHVQTTPLIAE